MKTRTKFYFGKRLAVLVTTSLFLVNVAHAQVTTSQDRTVVTMDISNTCTTQITDTLGAGGQRGEDQNLHDEDDTTIGALGDGFDQVAPSPTTDFTDAAFSDLTNITFDASSSNIVVDDPDVGTGSTTDGSGYVDLQFFDEDGNQYSADFNAEVTCDNANGYDLHIADTFNLAQNSSTLNYCNNDLRDTGQNCNPNVQPLVQREGLFRIAPNSFRAVKVYANPTATTKHEYIMDLPGADDTDCGAAMTNDNVTGDCPSASLDPFAVSNGLRAWPYTIGTPPADTNFGTVGFTLLCQQFGGTGAATIGTGRINPFSRGMASPNTNVFRLDAPNNDCDDDGNAPTEKYAAIPSLTDGGNYAGITGTNPGTYGAILSARNWVGYSGTITAGTVTGADNFFEVRATLPNNQTAGTYAGTIILSCLPNLTAEPELDFDGDYIGDDTTN